MVYGKSFPKIDSLVRHAHEQRFSAELDYNQMSTLKESAQHFLRAKTFYQILKQAHILQENYDELQRKYQKHGVWRFVLTQFKQNYILTERFFDSFLHQHAIEEEVDDLPCAFSFLKYCVLCYLNSNVDPIQLLDTCNPEIPSFSHSDDTGRLYS